MTRAQLVCCAVLAVTMLAPLHHAQSLPKWFGTRQSQILQETRRQPGDRRVSGPQQGGLEEVFFPQGGSEGQTPWQEVNRPPWQETTNPFGQGGGQETGNRQQGNNGNFNEGFGNNGQGNFGQGNNGNFGQGNFGQGNNGNFGQGNNGNFGQGNFGQGNNGNFGQGNNGNFGQGNFGQGNNGNFGQGNNNGGSWQGGNNRPATTRRPSATRATTTVSPSISAPSGCSCTSTSEYNPVCGTNNQTYSNPGKLNCAVACQQRNRQQQNTAVISLLHYGVCRRAMTDTRG